MGNEAIQRANKKFNRRRADREELINRRREEVYNKIPEIADIDNELSKCSFSAFSNVIDGGLAPDDAVLEFKNKVFMLRDKKQKLLIKNGYEQNYLEPDYICSKCNDTGLFKGKLCSCYKMCVSEELYAESNLGARLREQTFDKFDLSLYDDKIKDGTNPTARKNMQSIFNECKRFADEFSKHDNNLFLYGSSGLGKTFLSSCIANELINGGTDVFYQSAAQIFTSLDNVRFGKFANEKDVYLSERLLDCELLIIDDLGTEFVSTVSVSELFRIINTRLLDNKSTIISTNLSLSDIKNNYSERVLSRILGHYIQLKFYGNDIRLN